MERFERLEHRRAFGRNAEDAVAQWYRRGGYRVLASNWRCPEGELDLVLESPGGQMFVFCEVKARTGSTFGTPYDAVTAVKQQRIRHLASRWLSQARSETRRGAGGATNATHELRFDVAAVVPSAAGTLLVEVMEGAF
jgi:putative endonuclease